MEPIKPAEPVTNIVIKQSISTENIPGKYFILHIVQTTVVAVGDDGVAHLLEFGKVIDNRTSKERSTFLKRGFINDDFRTFGNDIAEQFRVDKRKSASILDTFSCVIQGIIPYGAQLLIAAELSGLSPINIIGYLYYPMTLGVVAILSILFRYPRRYS